MTSSYVLEAGQGFSICDVDILNGINLSGCFNGITPVFAEQFRKKDFKTGFNGFSVFLEKTTSELHFNNDPHVRVRCLIDGKNVSWAATSWYFKANENYTEFHGFYRDTLDGWFGAVRAALALHMIYELKGLLFHASSGFYNDILYLVIGRSGAGKTTAIRNFPGRVIQDEITGLTVNHEIRLWPTPFGGELEKGPDATGKVIFITLEKSGSDSIASFRRNHFLEISQSTVYPGGTEDINAKFLKLIEKIVDSSILIPVYATKRSGFWNLLKDMHYDKI